LIIDPVREFMGVPWREFKNSLGTRKSRESLFKLGISDLMMKKIAKCLKSPVIDNLVKSDIC
jgi:hypothetical protein